MLKWIVALVVVVALVVAGDVAARKFAEHQIAHDIVAHEKGSTATVHISSFPFVARLAISREIPKITADVKNVPVSTPVGDFKLDAVSLTLNHVKVDLGPLTAGSDGAVKSIKSGTVRAEMSEETISKLVKFPVTLGDGTVKVTVAGIPLGGTVQVVNGKTLHLSAAGFSLDVPLPDIPVLPCLGGLAIIPGYLVIACAFHQVPAAFLQAVGAA